MARKKKSEQHVGGPMHGGLSKRPVPKQCAANYGVPHGSRT